MRIFEKKDGKNDLKIFLKNLFFKYKGKKNILVKFLILTSSIYVIFLPLELFTSNRTLDFFRRTLNYGLGKIDIRYRKLAEESVLYGDNLYNISLRYLKSFLISEEEVKINLSFKNFKILQNKRNDAWEDGFLIRSANDKVSGNINYKGVNYPIRIRLTGNKLDHLIGDNWSFRIETRKDKSILGTKEFSLRHPRTRNYLNEYVFQQLLKYENLPYLRYRFLPLSINGKYLGIYSFEEHFAKELIENSQFREGPIIKLNTDDAIQERIYQSINSVSTITNYNEMNADILPFNNTDISKNEEQLSQYYLAHNLLSDFLRGELNSSQVFDLESTAKYFAISDLIGNKPDWYDLRFYFDPVLGRLIPVGYDANAPIKNEIAYGVKEKKSLAIDNNVLGIFNDPIFVKEYLKQVERLSKEEFLNEFISQINNDLKIQLSIINKSFPHVNFSKDYLISNQKYLLSRLSPKNPIGVRFNKPISEEGQLKLDIYNKSLFPIEIISVKYKDKNFIPNNQFFLKGKKKFVRISYETANFYQKDFIKNKNLFKGNNQIQIKYKLNGLNKINILNTKILPPIKYIKSKNQIVIRTPNVNDFQNIEVFEKNKEVLIKESFTLNKPLITPKGYKLIIKPGVSINLIDNGSIISNGPFVAKANEISPIIIKSQSSGNGILVLNAGFRSIIDNVVFNGLSSPLTTSLNITGGVTFYNSEVDIKKSKFLNGKSEDVLNLIRSNFSIKESIFDKSISDAIDSDFSDGSIENTEFSNIGNDSIDISGSKVTLKNIKILSSGDKGISVGEKSNLLASNINIKDAFIGIASKDLSFVSLNNFKGENLEICMAAYQKKSEYGPALIAVNNNLDSCGNKEFVLENRSSIKYISKQILPNTKNAYKELYPLD